VRFRSGIIGCPKEDWLHIQEGLLCAMVRWHCRTRTIAAYLWKSWRNHHLYHLVYLACMHFVHIRFVTEPVHLVVCGHLPLQEVIHEGEC